MCSRTIKYRLSGGGGRAATFNVTKRDLMHVYAKMSCDSFDKEVMRVGGMGWGGLCVSGTTQQSSTVYHRPIRLVAEQTLFLARVYRNARVTCFPMYEIFNTYVCMYGVVCVCVWFPKQINNLRDQHSYQTLSHKTKALVRTHIM